MAEATVRDLEARRQQGIYVPPWPAHLTERAASAPPIRDLYLSREAAAGVARDFTAELLRIDSDPDLSELGKSRARAVAATSARAKIDEFRLGVFSQGAAHLEAARRELVAGKEKRAETVADAVRAMELRSWFRSLSEEERLAALREALNDEDAEMLSAVHSAPRAMNLVPGERMREVIAEALSPKASAEVKDLEQAWQVAKASLDTVRDYVTRAAGASDAEKVAGFERGGAAS